MALQPSKLQLFQIGKETAYGDGSAANRRLKSVTCSVGYAMQEDDEEGQAFKGLTGSIEGKEHVTLDFSGKAAINDLLYFFASLYCAPVITTPTDGVLTRRWTCLPSMTSEDTFDSFTIEKGIAGDVSIIPGVRINDLTLAFDPGKASVAMTAKGIAMKATDGQSAFTATPTLITPYSMNGKQIGVYISDDPSDISTRIKPLKTNFSITGRHTPVYSLDDSTGTFEDTVESSFLPMISITVPKGSASNGYLDDLRAMTEKFIKIEVTGPEIETVGSPGTTYYHRFELTMPFTFRNPQRGDDQDTYCHTFDLKAAYDDTFGGNSKVVIDTELTAL